MLCGCRWKTCNCPWFNYDPILPPQPVVRYQDIRANEVPEPVQVPVQEVVEEEYDYVPDREGYGEYGVRPVRVQRANVYWSEY
jgi:hypothetical protein